MLKIKIAWKLKRQLEGIGKSTLLTEEAAPGPDFEHWKQTQQKVSTTEEMEVIQILTEWEALNSIVTYSEMHEEKNLSSKHWFAVLPGLLIYNRLRTAYSQTTKDYAACRTIFLS